MIRIGFDMDPVYLEKYSQLVSNVVPGVLRIILIIETDQMVASHGLSGLGSSL